MSHKNRPISIFSFGLVATVMAVLAVALSQAPAIAAGTTYYVDCSASSNGNGSQSSPWNNLATVNSTTFGPGDSILFQRGATCSGQLWPQGSGADGSPITIGAYGTGALPVISGGTNDATLKLHNQEYWDIQDIEVVGGTTFGIFVGGDGSNLLHHFHISNVVVHDVWGGNMAVKTTGLIVFGYDWTQHFDDVLVDGVTAYNTDMWAGIVVTGKGWEWQLTRSSNIVIRNSTVYNTYGDGIIAFSANNVLIENNVAYDTGNEPVETIGTPNSIWTWDCTDCVVQFNEAYLAASPGWDGGAFDIDYYSSNGTVQYNYGHDNDAYCVSIFASDGTTDNSIIRYNVCSNNARNPDLDSDRNAELYFAVWNSSGGAGYIENSQIYNNTFYWNPANPTAHYAIAGFNLWRGCCFTGSNFIMNNLIYADNPNMMYMGLDKSVTFDYNLYWYTGTGDPVFKWGRKTYTGFSAFQNGSGQEANGLYVNPMLNNPTYHDAGFPVNAFTLQSGSPAIDAGADLAALGYVTDMGSHDFFGNAIPANGVFDIGAHEYGGGAAPTDTPPPPTNTPEPPTLTPTEGPTPTPEPTNTPEPPTPTPTPGGSTVMHVEDIYTTDENGNPQDAFVAGTYVYFRVQVLDQVGSPVEGASVSCTVYEPDGSPIWYPSGTTGADGWAMFSQKTNKPNAKGTYTINVTDVAKSGATYDPGANVKDSHQFSLVDTLAASASSTKIRTVR